MAPSMFLTKEPGAMQLHTEVQDGQIIVTLPLSGYCASFRKPANSIQLVVRSAFTTDRSNKPISKDEFFAIAWDAANEKARELGWIV